MCCQGVPSHPSSRIPPPAPVGGRHVRKAISLIQSRVSWRPSGCQPRSTARADRVQLPRAFVHQVHGLQHSGREDATHGCGCTRWGTPSAGAADAQLPPSKDKVPGWHAVFLIASAPSWLGVRTPGPGVPLPSVPPPPDPPPQVPPREPLTSECSTCNLGGHCPWC